MPVGRRGGPSGTLLWGQGYAASMETWERLRPFATLALAVGLACTVPTGSDGPEDSPLVETHQAVLDGVVRGNLDQPLEDVDIVLRFAESSIPAPTTRTDGAGRFLLVLAIYNGPAGPDSAAATVYAFARPPAHSATAATHADVLVRFVPVGQAPLRTSVNLKLPVF